MVLSDVLKALRDNYDCRPSAHQVRYAIASGHVSRPQLDGSLRFDFSEANVLELVEMFGGKVPINCEAGETVGTLGL